MCQQMHQQTSPQTNLEYYAPALDYYGEVKDCYICGPKPITEFWRMNHSDHPEWLHSYCKECCRLYKLAKMGLSRKVTMWSSTDVVSWIQSVI